MEGAYESTELWRILYFSSYFVPKYIKHKVEQVSARYSCSYAQCGFLRAAR